MILDFSKLKIGDSIAIDQVINLEVEYFAGKNVVQIDSCRVNGQCIKKNGFIDVSVECEVDLTLSCNRCLTHIKKKIVFSINEQYTKDSYEFEYKDSKIDLKEDIKRELYLNLDENVLCQEDCKGLCMECGINLNQNSCNCENK